MISLYGDMFGSCPPDMGCVRQVWEAWWLKYHSDNVLYTLYPAHQVGHQADHGDHQDVGYRTPLL